MNVTKDMYEYLLNFADDRTILNMLSVNRKFNDEKLFEKLVRKKYSDLIEYREENETWKHFFIRLVYYVSRLKDIYDIDYFAGLNPFAFNYLDGQEALNTALTTAIRVGNLQMIKNLFPKITEPTIFKYLREAAVDGNIEILLYFWDKDPSLFVQIVGYLAYNGNIKTIQYLFDHGYIDNRTLNHLLVHAADGNYFQLVKYLIDRGANDIQSAIDYAQMGEHPEMVEFLRKFL